MRFLKFKYIFTFSLVFVLGIFLLIFFFGGLKVTALDNNNLEFDSEGFIDYFGYDANGKKIVNYDSEAELRADLVGKDPSTYEEPVIIPAKNVYYNTFLLKGSRIVAQNTKFTMFLDELTTKITVVENATCAAPSGKTFEGFDKVVQSTCTKKYSTLNESKTAPEEKSNFSLFYVGSNDKLSTIGFNSYSNSVQYNDLLEGSTQRHYKIKFDIENGIEILYEVGDFTVINSFFPQYFDREFMLNYFRGNLVFVVKDADVTKENKITYTQAYTWSAECAAYLEEKGLATVEPYFPGSGEFRYDEEGNKLPARYILTDILEMDGQGRTLNKLKMQIGVDYNPKDATAEGASPCVANPFMNTYMYGDLFQSYYTLVNKNEDETITYHTEWRNDMANSSPTFQLQAQSSLQFMKMYDYLYKESTLENPNYLYAIQKEVSVTKENFEQYPDYEIGAKFYDKIPVLYDPDPYDAVPGEPFIIGGYHARDEMGNFLFDEEDQPIHQLFTKEEADIQNDLSGSVVESNSPIFQLAMRFTLTENGLEATILNNSLREGLGKEYRDENGKPTKYSHDCRFGGIYVLPNLASNDQEVCEGQIILPDGSGAIMSFNSPKSTLGYTAYPKPIYGADKAFTFEKAPDTTQNQNMMFPMFGFLDKLEEKGILGIVDRGANITSIYANFRRTGQLKNVAYFRTLLRESETVYAGTYNTPFLKWASGYVDTDLKYIYQFLDKDEFIEDGKLHYVGLAAKYRDYLIDKYNLTENKDTTKKNVVSLNFLGAFEKREVTFGFAHKEDYSLTTFEQAKEIITELQAEGINDFNVAYTAWTSDSMEPEATNRVDVSKALGKEKELEKFYRFLQENSINLYPEVRVSSNKGYDFSFGNLKYTAKSIGSTYAHHREYVLATNFANSTVEPITMISPKFYNSLVSKYMKSYGKLGVQGAYLSDLGNLRIGDYSKKENIYAENGMDYQIDAMNKISENVDKLMFSSPFDYAFPYTDFAVNVPLESTLLGYYDYTIPFYQLVVSGLFDYTGTPVNYDSEHSANWYLLKALETGSNLSYMISYEDTKILLETDYTMYYNTFYANWKSQILQMNDIINATNIHQGRLTGHKILRDNVYEVEYRNENNQLITKMIINYNQTPYYDLEGLSVRPNWFAIIEEGE